jgi:hypothetical protein
MTNPNTKIQSEAVDKIHKIAKEAKMSVFMLVDEDLEVYDDECDLTQDEKDEIWERMQDALMEEYGNMLFEIIEDVKSNR